MSTGSGQNVVAVHVYDLTRGVVKLHSEDVFGETVHGLWHTGVVVFGREYFFEGGITSVPAGKTRFGRPKSPHSRKIVVGHTDLLRAEFERWVRGRERDVYGKLCYHLVDKNCNHFTNEAVEFLTGKGIPDDILCLPTLVESTAIGRLFSPTVDRFFGGWQWISLRLQWRFRSRLEQYWKRHQLLLGRDDKYAPMVRPGASAIIEADKTVPTRMHRRYIPCYHVPFDVAKAQASPFAVLSDNAQQRKLRVCGRPPPRVYGFGPGGAEDIARLESRLRAGFAACPSPQRATYADGLEGLIARLKALPNTVPEGCYRNIDASHSTPIVDATRLPEPEVACLAFMLAPIVAVWRYLLVTSMPCKPKSSDPWKADRDIKEADTVLAMHEGPGGFFPVPVKRSTDAASAAVAAHKTTFMAIMDAVSRLCLEPGMAILFLTEHLEATRFKHLCPHAFPEPAADAKLRGLILGKHGLVGDTSMDFDWLPVQIQILVLRCVANCHIAHPSLGRVAALGMAVTDDTRILEVLALQGRNAIHNKEHPMLRFVSATLLVNTACVLNKELALEKPPHHARRRESQQSSASAAAAAAAAAGGARAHEPYGRIDSPGASTQARIRNDSSRRTSHSSAAVAAAAAAMSAAGQPNPNTSDAWVPEEILHSTSDVDSKIEAGNVAKLRNMIVRALSRRLFNEHDFTLQKRILTGLYHACLYSETARTQLASLVLSFSHAKRLPDLETRYLARAIEFMGKTSGVPPPDMCFPGPVAPQTWQSLSSPKPPRDAPTAPPTNTPAPNAPF